MSWPQAWFDQHTFCYLPTWAAMGNMFGSRTPTDLPEFKKPAVGESEN